MLPRPGRDFRCSSLAKRRRARGCSQALGPNTSHGAVDHRDRGADKNGHNTTAPLALGIKDIEGIADHPLELLAFGLELVRKDVIVVHRVRHIDQIAVLGTDRSTLIIVIVVRDISEPLFGREFGGVKVPEAAGPNQPLS